MCTCGTGGRGADATVRSGVESARLPTCPQRPRRPPGPLLAPTPFPSVFRRRGFGRVCGKPGLVLRWWRVSPAERFPRQTSRFLIVGALVYFTQDQSEPLLDQSNKTNTTDGKWSRGVQIPVLEGQILARFSTLPVDDGVTWGPW